MDSRISDECIEYINTRNLESIEKGILEFLDISKEELEDLFNTLLEVQTDLCEWTKNYLEDLIDRSLTHIQLFHLSRRLVNSDLKESFNIEKLLLEETPISDFLKNHNVTFKPKDNHLDMYYKGHFYDCDLAKWRGGYLKSRLGNNSIKDYCVNGFAIRFNLEKNGYYENLSNGPEIIERIDDLFKKENILKDYYDNSKYYCIEYLIPISEIIIYLEGYEPKTDIEKTIVLLTRAIVLLFSYWCDQKEDDNIIIRLRDDEIIDSRWFIGAEELE